MSCYNEYLHHDFKQLGFPEYIKMLDREQRMSNFNFLTTQEKLSGPPFFGKYAADIRFTIINPEEETGKRPFIGLIQSTIFEASGGNDHAAVVSRQLYYPPFPDRRHIQADITHSLESVQRSRIALPAPPPPEFMQTTTHGMTTTRHVRR